MHLKQYVWQYKTYNSNLCVCLKTKQLGKKNLCTEGNIFFQPKYFFPNSVVI